MNGELILIGVPIGNYEDLSPRALSCLEKCDLILCEDTRESALLLSNFGLKKNLISYVGSFNKAIMQAKKFIHEKKMVGLISDRGMPCISDPGARIVSDFIKLGINVNCIPGPSSLDTAFCLTGYFGSFIFHGFLPRKIGDIKKVLMQISSLNYNLIFFESPLRLKKTLEIFAEFFENRNITIARELTKKYQKVHQGTIKELLEQDFKGECVIIVSKI